MKKWLPPQFLLCLLVLLTGFTAKGQLPSPNDPNYAAMKASMVPPQPPVPAYLRPSVPPPLTWSEGCYINWDDSYAMFEGNDDGSTDVISLPFTFTLYGVDYTQVWVNNNGNLTFTGPYGSFTSTGFPLEGMPMVAPFWADVDTRVGNTVRYQVFDHKFIATWSGVGVFPTNISQLDSFQVIISDGTEPSIGLGNNVAFHYGQMNWTTGTASGGSGGFGGTPATVGINAGDGTHFIQVGRFGENSSSYTDPESTSGVHYLEYNCFSVDVVHEGNIPPSVSGLPSGNVDTLFCGQTKTYYANWIGPEIGQTDSSYVDTGDVCGMTVHTTPGYTSVSRDTISITGSTCNMGVHHFYVTGYDSEGGITMDTVTIVVVPFAPHAGSNSPVCTGNTLSVTSATAGATSSYSWTRPGGLIATTQNINVEEVTTAAAGMYRLVVTAPGGCYAQDSTMVVVNTAPAASIEAMGATTICEGGSVTLVSSAGSTPGLTSLWSTGDTSASITVSAAGTYGLSVSNGACTTEASPVTVIVNPLPSAITGPSSVCEGTMITLVDSTAGGTWSGGSDGETVFANVSSTGEVIGYNAGVTAATYTSAEGCFVTHVFTVNPAPYIEGFGTACIGGTTSLSGTPSGGTWASSSTATATVNASGVVTGISAGEAAIIYTTGAGCITSIGIGVVPSPTITAVSGTSVCGSGSITLTSSDTPPPSMAFSGWSSSNTAVAVVDESGVVSSGGTSGTATITYTSGAGCTATIVVTMLAAPAPIAGNTTICVGGNSVLTESSVGNSWVSSNPSVVTIGLTSGLMTGISAGSALITFTATNGCTATTAVLVNPAMAAISGPSSVCAGSFINLTNASSGSWSSSAPSVASVTSTGMVTGAVAGTTIISYTSGASCYAVKLVTVLALPATITGNSSLCVGSTTALNTTTTGGSWISENTGIATVSSTGIVTGVTVGSVLISYVNTAGCARTKLMTIGSGVTEITGNTNMCVGISMNLTNATSGGTWSTSNAAVATVSGTGAVMGVSTGTAIITYTTGGGCYATAIINVSAAPSAIAGPASLCVGEIANFTDSTSGGMWVGTNDEVGYVSPAGGFVIGMSAGTITLSYVLEGGCYAVKTVTVKALPSAISGTATVCVGSTTTLSDATPVGVSWTSSDPSIASIGAGSGVVTGVATGIATITYTINTGCSITTDVTVNALPSAITGTFTVCQGSMTSLSAGSGGSWSSSAPSIASVTSTGLVTGSAAGTAIISYSAGAGCTRIQVVTVNGLPNLITGTQTVCTGSTTLLSTTSTGGVWSSSDAGTASVSGGVVTGNTAGTATISYTNAATCSRTTIVTVSTGATANTGTASLCVGSTTTLSNATTGGTWTTSNASVAGITSGGVVNGVAVGTANITYSLTAGCRSITTVTVNPAVAAITGATSVCAGVSTTLATLNTDGTWSSANTATATVDASGVVTGVVAGTVTISYISTTGCFAVKAITVKAAPVAIGGNMALCAGGTSVLTDASVTGMSWSSSNPSVATIGSNTGLVTAVSVGTTIVTYTLTSGCSTTAIVTVNSLPSSISGTLTTCVGSNTSLSSSTPGGSWTSSAPGVASVTSTGLVSGATAGNATISYSLGGACVTTAVVTVNAIPAAITGITTICQGSTSALSNTTTGGVWSSSNATVASVTGGVVTGNTLGAATITYSLGGGCERTTTVTVTAPATSITGTMFMCIGGTTTLSNVTPGGIWTSGTTGVATIGGSGLVSGIAAGVSNITYTLTAGCRATATVTVNTGLTPITGTTAVLVGNTTALSNTTLGGVWSSSNTTYATVDASGVVTGVGAGRPIITYAVGGCYATLMVTVSAPPSPILGNLALCLGNPGGTLTDATPGVMWSSSDPSIATIGSASGVVSPVSTGTATISYQTTSGIIVTAVVTVGTMPVAISGAGPVCVGSTITLTDPSTGVWNSGNTAYATVDASGVVTGVAQGSVVISYSDAGCSRIAIVTVNPLPNVIAGATPLCVGSTATLADATTGGTWISSDPSVATIASGTGVMTGISAGVTTMSYRLTTTGCARTQAITVTVPTPNTGGSNLCVGNPIAFGNATAGGTWSSSSSAATVGTNGIVTGVTAGPVNITYTLGAGCRIITNATVNTAPANIGGTANACIGASSTLTDATSGGAWTSSNTGLATVVSGTGVVTGVAAGTPIITYTAATTGCYKTIAFTVKALPAPIGGSSTVCTGATINLTLSGSGSSITSSTPSVATVNGSGVVSGVSAGVTTITYTITSGCSTTKSITVNSAGTITGPASVSVAASTLTPVAYTSSVTGGAWASSNVARATIGGATGLLTGVTAGPVTVSYTNAGCVATKAVTIVTPRAAGTAAGMDEQAATVSVYPNPSTGIFNISTETTGTLTVFSLDGKILNNYEVGTGVTVISLPQGTAAGNYMCRFNGADGSIATIQLVYKP